eukprot:295608_1
MSVPRTKNEIKHYRIARSKLQRSNVNQNRLRRRDIMINPSTTTIKTESASSKHSTVSAKKNKTKSIRKLQKCSKKIEDKFRKKYHKSRTSHHKNKMQPNDGENHVIQLAVADVCFDFQNHGQCKRGEYCRYEHVAASKSLCLDWKNGHCPRGDVCRFAHHYASDIVQPKRYNQKNNSVHPPQTNKTQLTQMPSLVQNNILIKGVAPWIHRGPVVIPTRTTAIHNALPKIIQTRSRLNVNNTFARTRAPIPVIVRDTSAQILRRNHYSLTHPVFNRNRSNIPHLREPNKSTSLSPSPMAPVSNTYDHRAALATYRSYTENPNHRNEDVEEFDFEKLGDQIQSTIPRNKLRQANRRMPPPSLPNQRCPYKLAPHPPAPPPAHVARGYTPHNALPYPPYSYKYKYDARASSAYVYPQEMSNRNRNNRMNNNI